jgi:hypothetical protein
MHPHTIALAEARIAELQRAAIHSTATVPRRRHHRGRRALVLLGLAATAALAPAGAANAHGAPAPKPQNLRALGESPSIPAARPEDASTNRADALHHEATMRSLAARRRRESEGVGRTVASPGTIVPAARTQVAGDGFSWADGAIGAGLAAALLLGAAGVASVRRPGTMRAQ